MLKGEGVTPGRVFGHARFEQDGKRPGAQKATARRSQGGSASLHAGKHRMWFWGGNNPNAEFVV